MIDSVDFEDDSVVLAAQMIESSLNNAAAALQRAEREMQPTISSASSTSSKQSEFATNRVLLRKSVCTAELAEDVESAYSSLLMTTSSSMMSTLHPCHKLFMLAYATLPRLALIKLNSNIFEDDGEEVGKSIHVVKLMVSSQWPARLTVFCLTASMSAQAMAQSDCR